MAVSIEQVTEALKKINYPGLTRDIVSFGMVKDIKIDGDAVELLINFTTNDLKIKDELYNQIRDAVLGVEGVKNVNPVIEAKQYQDPKDKNPFDDQAPIPGIKSILAVASGKGGVGKSTVSTNLAIALVQKGLKVGLLDADVYGPSVQMMMGSDAKPAANSENKIFPVEKFGLKMMSMGFIVDQDVPIIWRGALATKAIKQFLGDVLWGELDVLVIDMPPGTGDIQLTLVQQTPLSGALIVTTPQDVALLDARRGLKMFEKVDVPVVGIVENMSYYIGPKCGHKDHIFSSGGGERAAGELNTEFLGELPIDAEVAIAGDEGEPIILRKPEGEHAKRFTKISEKIISILKI